MKGQIKTAFWQRLERNEVTKKQVPEGRFGQFDHIISDLHEVTGLLEECFV